MQMPFDQFQKALLTVFLELVAEVETEREVPSQPQSVDMLVTPDERAEREQRLGWLGRLAAQGQCMIECFSRTPGVGVVDGCVRKQLVLHQELLGQARRNGEPAPAKPRLWILSAGRPRRALEAYEARPMEGWPTGVWQARDADALHIVVIRELPREPETLLLRLLGRGRTLAEAWAEVLRLPPGAWQVERALPMMVAFERALFQYSRKDDDMTMRLLQEIRAKHEQMMREVRAEGREEGLEEGREASLREVVQKLLERRFGPVPAPLVERIRGASRQELEAWIERVLDARTLADVLD